MSRIKDDLSKLNEKDIYSLLLYALYKLNDVPKYSTLSELSFVLDKQNLLKFCQYFGGTTISVPTLSEMENMINTLLLYQYIDIEGLSMEDALKKLNVSNGNSLKKDYEGLRNAISGYNLSRDE